MRITFFFIFFVIFVFTNCGLGVRFGDAEYDDKPKSVHITTSGSFYVTGNHYLHRTPAGGAFFSQLNNYGDVLFSSIVGDELSQSNTFDATIDNGFILAGTHKNSISENPNILISKVDSQGNVQWSKSVGGNGIDVATSIISTSDNGFVLTGYTNSYGLGVCDVIVLKFSSSGSLVWGKNFGKNATSSWRVTGSDVGLKIIEVSSGGYLIAGYSDSFGLFGETGCVESLVYDDLLLAKISSTGDMEWLKVYGGNQLDYAFTIIETTEGGFLVAGKSSSYGSGPGGFDIFAILLDSSGSVEWSFHLRSKGFSSITSVIETEDGGFMMTGYAVKYISEIRDLTILKVDRFGVVEWIKTYETDSNTAGIGIVHDQYDGEYIIVAEISDYNWPYMNPYDVLVIKLLDETGEMNGCNPMMVNDPIDHVFPWYNITLSVGTCTPLVNPSTEDITSLLQITELSLTSERDENFKTYPISNCGHHYFPPDLSGLYVTLIIIAVVLVVLCVLCVFIAAIVIVLLSSFVVIRKQKRTSSNHSDAVISIQKRDLINK